MKMSIKLAIVFLCRGLSINAKSSRTAKFLIFKVGPIAPIQRQALGKIAVLFTEICKETMSLFEAITLVQLSK